MDIIDRINKSKEKLLKEHFKIFTCKIQDVAVNFMGIAERYDPSGYAKRYVLLTNRMYRILPDHGSDVFMEKFKQQYSLLTLDDLRYFIPLDKFSEMITKPLLEDFISDEELAKMLKKAKINESYIQSETETELEKILMNKMKVKNLPHYAYKIMFPSPQVIDILGPDYNGFTKFYKAWISIQRRIKYYHTGDYYKLL